jgi:transcriptional regulator with XRE-family HTH domain
VKINGPTLKAVRELSGMSQTELASRTGLSQNRISTIESSSPNVRPATAKTLAEALGQPIAVLTGLMDAAS